MKKLLNFNAPKKLKNLYGSPTMTDANIVATIAA